MLSGKPPDIGPRSINAPGARRSEPQDRGLSPAPGVLSVALLREQQRAQGDPFEKYLARQRVRWNRWERFPPARWYRRFRFAVHEATGVLKQGWRGRLWRAVRCHVFNLHSPSGGGYCWDCSKRVRR